MLVEGINDGGLPCARKKSFATLPSPPQYQAAFGTMPLTLASVDQSPVRRSRTLPPSSTRAIRVGFWTEGRELNRNIYSWANTA
jgi:hypothetical protein